MGDFPLVGILLIGMDLRLVFHLSFSTIFAKLFIYFLLISITHPFLRLSCNNNLILLYCIETDF